MGLIDLRSDFIPKRAAAAGSKPPMLPTEAQVVVVGADDSEKLFAFDALVENEDGETCMFQKLDLCSSFSCSC